MIENKKEKVVSEILDVIDSIRFYINQDGGDLEFIDFDIQTGIVKIKVLGACVGCSLIDVTYKDGVETILTSEIPEVKSVEIIEDESEMLYE